MNASATDIAPYINDTMSSPSSWKVVAGVRYDRYDAKLDELNQPSAFCESGHRLHQRASGCHLPANRRAVLLPLLRDFLQSVARDSRLDQRAAKPRTGDQRPVRARRQVGRDGRQLSLTAAIFQIEKDNTRSQISTGVFELTGNVRVQGFQATAAGRLTPLWQVFAGYTDLDAEIVKASALDGTQGKVPANTPRDSASFWTTYLFAREWQAGTGVVQARRIASPPTTMPPGSPSYLRWDAMVAYEQPKYSIQLNIFNLANRLNYDVLIPSDRADAGLGHRSPGVAQRDLQVRLTQRTTRSVLRRDVSQRIQCPRSGCGNRPVLHGPAGDAWVDGRATAVGHQGSAQ